MINREHFFTKTRNGFKKLNQSQVDGFNAVLSAWENKGFEKEIKWREKLAYCLATFWHETAFTMQPIEEFGKGKGHKYGTRVKLSGKRYDDVIHLFYGRGHVQLTWYENYQKMSKYAEIDLVKNPHAMLDMETSIKVSIAGMINGEYTGKSLSRYFSANINDPYFARRVVNGMKVDARNPKLKVDVSAKNIEKYYHIFLQAIQAYPND
jgi:hypothetical protein